MAPDGMLSSSDLAGILLPAVPAGIPFPVGSVGSFGMLSPSYSVGPVGPDGTLSPSDFEYAGPVAPVGTFPPCDNVTELSLIVPVGELLSVDPVRRPPWGVGSARPDRISGREGSGYYTVACRGAGRGLLRCRGYGRYYGQLSDCSGCD